MKINNKKIIKYAGASVLTTTLLLGGSFAIYDATFDHTKDVCTVTQILSLIENGNLGRKHQMNEMWDEYLEKEMDIDGISYGNYDDTKAFIPIKDNESQFDMAVKMK